MEMSLINQTKESQKAPPNLQSFAKISPLRGESIKLG